MKSSLKACAPFVPACPARVSMCTALLRYLPASLLAIAALPAFAQVSLTALDVPYTQNFDSLPSSGTLTWTSNSTIAGWYLERSGTPVPPFSVSASNGNSNAGGFFSYGTGTASERALGSQGSNATADQFYGLRLQNNTGATISSLDVAYAGEQWRNGGNTATQSLVFSYLTGPGPLISLSSAGTAFPALDFPSPITGSTAAPLDGNAAANRTTISATITGLNIPPGSEVLLRWKDVNDAGNDHGLAVDDVSITPHGSAISAHTLGINDVSRNEGNAGTTSFDFTVTLSSAASTTVTVDYATADGTANTPSDYIASSGTLTFAAGQTSATISVMVNGDTQVEPDETFFVNLSNPTGGAVIGDAQGQGTIVNDDTAVTITRIHAVQGSGPTTPMAGTTVTVEAIATAVYLGTGKLGGFFLQEADTDVDTDPTTSEGIFVFCPSCPAGSIAEGQRVRVTGSVSEYFNMTQLTPASAANVTVTDSGNLLDRITPQPVSLPISGDVDAFYEAREGMLVTYGTPLTVSEYFELPRYGQIQLVAGARPRQFTEDNPPSASGYAAHLADLRRRQIILDDDNNMQNSVLSQPSGSQALYWPRTNGGLSVGSQGADFFRGGDQVANLTGVLHWSFAGLTGTDAWRIRPTTANPVTFTPVNARPATPPAVGGAIRAVGLNLLNYFTTIDTTSSSTSGACGPSQTMDCRGADSLAELNRQRARTAAVLCALDADVAGLVELENTTPSDTITDLLGAVNALCANGHPYQFANTGGTLGGDAIRVQIIYRSGVLTPVGAPLTDDNAIHDRPPTAQTFDVSDSTNPAYGQRFTVIASHFKSKGSCPANGANADQNDGQGCWAEKRTQQASRLLTWINGSVIPAAGDPDVLLLGDYNAYASETAITTLKAAGYVDMQNHLHGTDAYSYLFNGQLGHLDYALASSSLAGQITGTDAWHINADEVPAFDYNDEIKDVGEQAQEQKPDGSNLNPPRFLWEQPAAPYRASDHDPMVVGLFSSASADLAVSISDAPDPVVAGNPITYTITVSNAGADAASSVVLSDTLPTGTTFVSMTSPSGWSCALPPVGGSGTASCSLASFAVGNASFTLTVATSAGLAGGTVISNTATVASGTFDPASGNNAATATTTVTAAPQGQLAIAPTSLAFGNQTVGTTAAARTVTLSNNGNASLNVTALTAATASFARSGGSCATTLPITIAAGANCTLTYTFTPTAVGPASQSLTVTANAPGSGSIALSGTGTQGRLLIAPASLVFGNVEIGATSAAQSVTLSNDGSSSLDVTALTTASAPFARSGGNCASTLPFALAQGASCTLAYTFAPGASGAASQSLTVTANAPGSGTIALSGNGTVPAVADVAVSISDNRNHAQVGDTLNYVITVSNANGPATASVLVQDALPNGLADGSWTCTPTGTATCAGGSGNVLGDTATLPSGTQVSYLYSATVQASAADTIVNQVTAQASNVSDPNPVNNGAEDTTLLVIFRDGFELGGNTLALLPYSDGHGFVSAVLTIDRDLLGTIGVAPVEVASGRKDDGRLAFTLELARFGAVPHVRLTSIDADGTATRGAWQATELEQPLDFAWQSASGGKQDGFLRIESGATSLSSVERGDSARLVQLRIPLAADATPWLSIQPK